MAFPTSVNDQITDSISQVNVKVLGDAPAQAMATLYQSMSQVAGAGAQNALSAQQNAHDVAVAVTSKCINALLGSS